MGILSNIKKLNWKDFNIFEVVEGCTEAWLIDLKINKDHTQKISKYRLSICEECEVNSDGICDQDKWSKNVKTGNQNHGCGCVLKCKAALLSQECPLSKWLAVNSPSPVS